MKNWATTNDNEIRLSPLTLRASSPSSISILRHHDSMVLAVIGAESMLAQAKCEMMEEEEGYFNSRS